MTAKAARTPSVARFVRELIYGPEPVGVATMQRLAGYKARDLGHGPGSTIAHVFMKGEDAVTFLGYVASPQEFIGAAQMGANRNLTVQDYPALPSDNAPPSLPAVQALLDPFGQFQGVEW
jgi:hypothetical protein